MKKNFNNLENLEILKKYKDLSKSLLIHSSRQSHEIFKFIEDWMEKVIYQGKL